MTTSTASVSKLLIPKGDYFFTPLLIYANVLLWIIMAFAGAGTLNPNVEVILNWGANYKSLTMYGESWRLITSLFIHFGIVHLVMNMLALFELGTIVEQMIGRLNFIVLYLICGLSGNIASLWWHDYSVVSAGASGSIFGILGAFSVLYAFRLVHTNQLQAFLGKIVLFIGFNLLPGLFMNIDNSAHIGGLLTGIVCGMALSFDLSKKNASKPVQYIYSSIAMLLIASASYGFWKLAIEKKDVGVLFNEFAEMEERANRGFFAEQDPDAFNRNVVKRYENCFAIVSQMEQLSLPDEQLDYTKLLKQYADFRVKQSKLKETYLRTLNPAYNDSIAAWDTLIYKVAQRIKEKK